MLTRALDRCLPATTATRVGAAAMVADAARLRALRDRDRDRDTGRDRTRPRPGLPPVREPAVP